MQPVFYPAIYVSASEAHMCCSCHFDHKGGPMSLIQRGWSDRRGEEGAANDDLSLKDTFRLWVLTCCHPLANIYESQASNPGLCVQTQRGLLVKQRRVRAVDEFQNVNANC